jgi:transcriptional regulator with XRE-family HTH domain
MLPAMKTDERLRARRLRREEGRSIKEIARLVGVSVSSVSLWVRDIELTDEQVNALRERNSYYNRQFEAWRANAERARRRRQGYQDEGRALARLGVAKHAAGVMLYWAEGDKSNRNSVRLSNADPHLVRFFLDFLREYFDVPDSRIRITCYLFADHVAQQHERAVLVGFSGPASIAALPIRRQCLFEVQPEETAKQAALWVMSSGRLRHVDTAEHLRLDPGVRRLRAAGMARLTERALAGGWSVHRGLP